jgi:hypothetical protein
MKSCNFKSPLGKPTVSGRRDIIRGGFQIERATISPFYIDPTYPVRKITLPYNTQHFTLAIGMTLVFDSSNDKVGNGNLMGSNSYNKRNGRHKSRENSHCNCSLD